MANVTGVVEVIMQNKFNADKIAMKLVDNDTWYGQSKDWMEVMPKRGDTVSFSPGKQKDGTPGKYIQYLEILEHAAGESKPASTSAKGTGGGFNALGVELGHAANNAVALLSTYGTFGTEFKMDDVRQVTKEFYDMMKELRAEYEGAKVVSEEAPKASAKPKAKPKAKPVVEDDPDDDIPF